MKLRMVNLFPFLFLFLMVSPSIPNTVNAQQPIERCDDACERMSHIMYGKSTPVLAETIKNEIVLYGIARQSIPGSRKGCLQFPFVAVATTTQDKILANFKARFEPNGFKVRWKTS